jgi:transposase
MPRKTNVSLIDDAERLISQGLSLVDISKQIGVNAVIISRELKQRGVSIPSRRGRPERLNLPIEDIKTMYQRGKSENAIAKHFGVSRPVIRGRLLEVGVKPRTQSEAEKLKWSQMNQEARAKQVKNAHESNKGRTQNIEAGIAFAKTREKLKYNHLIGFGEVEFIEFLTQKGIDFIHQKAVYKYNLDFAIGNIAVELSADCCRYRRHNTKEIKRAENLLEFGYHVIGIFFDTVETLRACSDDLLTYINMIGRLKPTDREYWVVGCRMQDCTIVPNKFGQFTSIPSPKQFITKRTVVKLD